MKRIACISRLYSFHKQKCRKAMQPHAGLKSKFRRRTAKKCQIQKCTYIYMVRANMEGNSNM